MSNAATCWAYRALLVACRTLPSLEGTEIAIAAILLHCEMDLVRSRSHANLICEACASYCSGERLPQ